MELFNLVATGTREGDALLRLLENLCAAANELDGRCSIRSAWWRRLLSRRQGSMTSRNSSKKTYETGNAGDIASQAVQNITKDRLRQIHDLTRRQKTASVGRGDGQGDLSTARRELGTDQPTYRGTLPHQDRRAGLIEMERAAVADEGLWYLSAGSLPLPSEFTATGTLVATSGAAKRDALNAGNSCRWSGAHPRAR